MITGNYNGNARYRGATLVYLALKMNSHKYFQCLCERTNILVVGRFLQIYLMLELNVANLKISKPLVLDCLRK